ncbi:hypothetical protein ACQKQD_33675 [Methylobacterium sp. NPDC080182]|uniref:hypothetical protein n=1 Tax=Methylobacterium sp. NPDC080182 TaxID=3390590 RepID=UPI003D031E93
MPKLIKDSFSAWIDKMPGTQEKLILKGEAEVPTGGWKSSVRPASPPGINKDILIVEVDLIKPTGAVTQVISKIECRYEETPPKNRYTDVTVRFDGEEFTIPVGETS